MENKVVLEFDKSISRVAGYDLGQSIYQSQVAGKIDYTREAYIEFPQEIIKAASSFVQGFFEEIVRAVGIKGIGTQVHLICSESLLTSIREKL